MTTTDEKTGFEHWSILELMGHRRLGGFVREVQVAGAGFLRIDVPSETDGETHSTQFYPPSSVYCLTPVSEEAARIVARSSRPEPVAQWEIPKALGGRLTKDCTNCGTALAFDNDGPLCLRCQREEAFDHDGKTDRGDF